jgi:hypothetical protein
MTLKDKIKTTIIKDLKQIDILFLNNYAMQNKDILNLLYDKGVIGNTLIENALEQAVFHQARNDYDTLIAEDKDITPYTDHVEKPDCLAYALSKGKFSKEEIEKIPFSDGDTIKKFTKGHSKKGLLSVLREGLLNPKPPLVLDQDWDPHP